MEFHPEELELTMEGYQVALAPWDAHHGMQFRALIPSTRSTSATVIGKNFKIRSFFLLRCTLLPMTVIIHTFDESVFLWKPCREPVEERIAASRLMTLFDYSPSKCGTSPTCCKLNAYEKQLLTVDEHRHGVVVFFHATHPVP